MAPTVLLLLLGTVSVSSSVIQASGPRPQGALSPEFQALIDTCERALVKYQTSTEMVPKDLDALWASALQRDDKKAMALITVVQNDIMKAKACAVLIKGVQVKIRQHKYPDTSFKSLYRTMHDKIDQFSTILQRIDKFVEDWPKTYDNSNVNTNVDPNTNGKVNPDTNVNTNGGGNSNNNINSNTNVNSNIEVNIKPNTNSNVKPNVKPNTNVNSNIEVNSNTNENSNIDVISNTNTSSNIKPNTNSAGKYCFKCIKVSAAITGLVALGALIGIGKAIGGSFYNSQDHGDNTGSLDNLVTSSSTLGPTVGVTTLEPSAFGPIIIIGGIVLIVLALIALVYFLVYKRASSSGHDPETGKSGQNSFSGPSSIDDSKVNKSKAEKSKAYSNKRGQSSNGAMVTPTTGTPLTTTLSTRAQGSKGI